MKPPETQLNRRRRAVATVATKLLLLGLPLAGAIVWLATKWTSGTAAAATISGGVAAGLALLVAIVGTRFQLVFLLFDRKVKKLGLTHLTYSALVFSEGLVDLSGSWKEGGKRSHAIARFATVAFSWPHVPEDSILNLIECDEDSLQRIRDGKDATEALSSVLHGHRHIYFRNLTRALRLLSQPIAAEIGGHSYVTDHWEQDAWDWLVCLENFILNMRTNPLGGHLSETQLLMLLDRMLLSADSRQHSQPLRQGGLVRCRTADGGLVGPYELTADPEIVNLSEVTSFAGAVLPQWRLQLIDASDQIRTVDVMGTSFEISPSSSIRGNFPLEGLTGP